MCYHIRHCLNYGIYADYWFHNPLILQAFQRHGKIPRDVHVHFPVPKQRASELLYPSLVSYQRLTCYFMPLIKQKRFWKGCRPFTSAQTMSIAEGFFQRHDSVPQSSKSFAARKWNTTGKELGKDWPLTGESGETQATRTLKKRVRLSPNRSLTYKQSFQAQTSSVSTHETQPSNSI